MTAAGMVTIRCERCGRDAERMYPGGCDMPRYCSASCRRIANSLGNRVRRGMRCLVCGGLPESCQRDHKTWLCRTDGDLVWRTCEGKWAALSAEAILDVHLDDDRAFAAYECPMCLRWHRTSGSGEIGDKQLARQRFVGAILRSSGFTFREALWIPVSTR